MDIAMHVVFNYLHKAADISRRIECKKMNIRMIERGKRGGENTETWEIEKERD